MTEIKDTAFKYAIKNAFLHNGKANIGAVVGKVKALHKEIDLKKEIKLINAEVEKVNQMTFDEIKTAFKKFEEHGFELKAREKKEGLPELDWAEKEKVVTRFAPNPNGPFHLGNARAAILSHEYAQIYDGKFLLRFDDTDPKVKKPIENAEQIFKEDLEWLGLKVNETFFASDRLEIYYEYMQKLVEMEKAYVCDCNPEEWREKIKNKTNCGCRNLKKEEQIKRLEKMFSHEYKEGEVVLRIKTDLNHKDPSVRDWWAAKIVDNPAHVNPKTNGKIVWPSYNFASAIDDHLLGMTLIIRGQEHEQNATKQKFLYDYFDWTYPHLIHNGRIAIEGMVLSTSKISKGIADGTYTGWDDPRLGTIRALRKRGFQAQALKELILSLGTKSNDSTVEWKTLASINKKLIEEKANKVGFFKNPIKLSIDFAPEKTVEVNGMIQELNKGTMFFIVEKESIDLLKEGDVFRLREAYNVKLKSKLGLEATAEFVSDVPLKTKVLPWAIETVDLIVVMPDNSKIYGAGDLRLLNLKENDLVFLERLGFARIEETKNGRYTAFFAHK